MRSLCVFCRNFLRRALCGCERGLISELADRPPIAILTLTGHECKPGSTLGPRYCAWRALKGATRVLDPDEFGADGWRVAELQVLPLQLFEKLAQVLN